MEKPKIPLIVIILTIVLIIGGLIFVFKHSNKESLLKTKYTKYEENLKDSDNDGLKDWEEELYRTNSNNPDTDGDGYLDGEEIAAGTNPLIKAPGDKLVFYPLPLGEKYNITKKLLNEEIIGSMLDSYLAQKGEYINDHNIDSPEIFAALTKQSTIKTMSRWALEDIYPILLEKAQQTISEIPEIFKLEITDEHIKISRDNSPEAINLYLSQISSIFSSETFFLQEQSLKILESALKTQNFSRLDQLIKTKDDEIERLKEIIVPSLWKENHKKRLEYSILLRNIFISLRDFQNDPLKAYIALGELEKFANKWNGFVEETKNLAESQNIKLTF